MRTGEEKVGRKRGLRRVVVDWRMQKVARVFEILLWVFSVVEENVRLRRDDYELGMAWTMRISTRAKIEGIYVIMIKKNTEQIYSPILQSAVCRRCEAAADTARVLFSKEELEFGRVLSHTKFAVQLG